jgi:hypothetical protein
LSFRFRSCGLLHPPSSAVGLKAAVQKSRSMAA